MEKVYIFGAGGTGQIFVKHNNKYEILGFLDNNSEKWGGVVLDLTVFNPNHIANVDFDKVIITTAIAIEEVKNQLIALGVPDSKIDLSYVDKTIVQARTNFLSDYAKLNPISNESCVAEAGVFRGDFAKEINQTFKDSKLYLFDTFEGFSEKDFSYQEKDNDINNVYDSGHLSNTSEELVLSKMPFSQNCIIKKGYFPDTTKDIPSNETFHFVNLDMDLYLPTLKGLEYFYPKMDKNGCIVVHDYFSLYFVGVKKAVDEFIENKDICLIPIGDTLSIAIIVRN